MSGAGPKPVKRRFDAAYLEVVTLKDGRLAALRCVRPSDRALFVNGFRRLSDESRYRRFFTPKPRLSERELDYLTAIDGEHHFALGLALCDEAGEPLNEDAGLGVARFIRLAEDPDTAESAIAVVDEAQGLGLGRLLFKRLVEAATEREVRRFRTEVLSSNNAMRGLVESVVGDLENANITETRDGSILATDFELPRPLEESEDHQELLMGPLYELLRAAAVGRAVATRAVAELLRWRTDDANAVLKASAKAEETESPESTETELD